MNKQLTEIVRQIISRKAQKYAHKCKDILIQKYQANPPDSFVKGVGYTYYYMLFHKEIIQPENFVAWLLYVQTQKSLGLPEDFPRGKRVDRCLIVEYWEFPQHLKLPKGT